MLSTVIIKIDDH